MGWGSGRGREGEEGGRERGKGRGMGREGVEEENHARILLSSILFSFRFFPFETFNRLSKLP